VSAASDASIAVFIHALEGGGAQRDAILLANALARAGRRITILTLAPDGNLAGLVAPEVAVRALGASRLRWAAPALCAALLDLAPDVLLSSEVVPNSIAYLATRLMPAGQRPRLVLREVASPSVARREDPYGQSRAAYRFIGKVYARADRVLTLTEGARNDLIDNFGVPPERVRALGCNAVIDPATASRIAAHEPEAAAREPGLIVALGRLSPEKDHLTLLEAMRRLPPDIPARLVIVGDGPRRQRIEARIAELGLGVRATCAGHAADPYAWLLKAELLVSSSRFEGFGNAIVEALACGTPVVATDCPFGPREILSDGRYGRLVPVGDPDALAAAIAAALAAGAVDRAPLIARAAAFSSSKAAEAVLAAL
jgi:glycosyltransferase involved in cell wall biosynthesis